jgi:hypothetical protein
MTPEKKARLPIDAQLSACGWVVQAKDKINLSAARGTKRDSVVLDTKWKVPKDGQPADDDLKQMFTYNLHFGARRSLLIYPRANPLQSERITDFAPSSSLPSEYRHSCGMCFVDLFDSNLKLRNDIGQQILRAATQQRVRGMSNDS